MNYDELTAEDLQRMQVVDIRTVNIKDLTDLKDINIDTKLPVNEKLRSFAEQSSNLYIHRVGNFVVKVSFQKEGSTINDKMENIYAGSQKYIYNNVIKYPI